MKLLKQLMTIPKKSITIATSITAAMTKNTKVRGAHARILKNRSTYRALLLSSVRSTTRVRPNGPNGKLNTLVVLLLR
jgi:hypothetical protein